MLLPLYLKRASSVEELLPWLYLKGVSTGDFSEALSALFGPEAKGVSPATISRLKAKWSEMGSSGHDDSSATSISGPMASTSTFVLMNDSAFWSSAASETGP